MPSPLISIKPDLFSRGWGWQKQLKGAASHPRTLCRVVARGSYLRNSCSYHYEAKAIVEAFDRIVYKRKVMPFLAIKLTCASELEGQALKTKVSPHGEDNNRSIHVHVAFSSAMLRNLIFLPTELLFAM